MFAHDRVDFHGQPIFAVIATSRDTARRAALLGEIEIDAEKPNVSVEQGKASGERVLPDYAFVNGDVAKAVAGSPCHTAGALHIGGQEHFYLEGQIAMAVPGEDGAVLVYSCHAKTHSGFSKKITATRSLVAPRNAHKPGISANIATCNKHPLGGPDLEGFGSQFA